MAPPFLSKTRTELSSFDLRQYLATLRTSVDQRLKDLLPPAGQPDPLSLNEAMSYAVLAGGKRIRPCLTIAICEALGGKPELALDSACALEFVHSYSLVHDDLPAMDDDELRRGQPTCHIKYGQATAILVGDALLTLAFEVLANSTRPGRPQLHLSIVELAKAAGARGMVGGQAIDMAIKDKAGLKLDALEQCHRLKTAALFSAAATLGALAAGATEEKIASASKYGMDLGLAFQHADDLRDEEFIELREQALARTHELCNNAIQSAQALGDRSDALISLCHLVIERAIEGADEVPTKDR
jgi:geranylgeranyl diphosphate synthase, type II